jgi:O-antigen ligase
MPWLTVLVARDSPGAIDGVCRTLAYFGAASAATGIAQFFFGPTPIDLAWAEKADEISIGARHLMSTLEDSTGVFYLWRPTGLQADGFSYAMILMTAFAALWVAWVRRSVPLIAFVLVGGLLVVGIALSLVRGIWLSFAVFVAFSLAARAVPPLTRPSIAVSLLIVALVASQIVGQYLYEDYRWYAGMTSDPVITRALTTGTVEARLGVWPALGEAIDQHGVFGIGYGGHIWIAHKFLPAEARSGVLNVHNVVTELMVLVGIPGVILFLAILYIVFRGPSGRQIEFDSRERRVHTIIAGYLVGMVVSGFTNGGVFLGFHFFFFAGAIHALRTHQIQQRNLPH